MNLVRLGFLTIAKILSFKDEIIRGLLFYDRPFFHMYSNNLALLWRGRTEFLGDI